MEFGEDKAAEVRKTAAAWVDRLTSGSAPTRTDIAQLRTWLAADPAHRAAYERARAIWVELARTDLAHPERRRLPRLAGLAMAASIALACWLAWPAPDVATREGQIRHVRLADGTGVWLDSASAVDIRLDETSRTVRLLKGRAAFDIARDSRPFEVVAGDARITDIGTYFSVDRFDGLAIAVRSGAVNVAKNGRHTALTAGKSVLFASGEARPRSVGPDSFAWQDHRLVLDNARLDEALAALDRYYPGRIVLVSSEVGANRVSGTLRVDRPEIALQTLLRSQHLQVTRWPWLTLVSHDDR